MKRPAAALVASFIAVLASGTFVLNRCEASRHVHEDKDSARNNLQHALSLIAQHPGSFGWKGESSIGESLKAVAQESAARQGVTIGYLAENEHDTDKGRRERQVIIRLTNASHSNLVHFLQDLERRGTGAWIKEIHVRPSREISEAYEEAEIVVSKAAATTEEKKP
jgi:hypothetical protein